MIISILISSYLELKKRIKKTPHLNLISATSYGASSSSEPSCKNNRESERLREEEEDDDDEFIERHRERKR